MFLHIDIDCFFVSAHRTLDDSLFHIPVAVGGRSNLNIFSSKKEVRQISTNSGAFVSTILTNEGQKSFKEYFVDENGKIRGIITTASYEARAFGVKTAMSVNEALSLCPHLKMLPPNYPLYHELSTKLKELLVNDIPMVEQFSIDEFFGDVTGYIGENEIVEFAYNLKKKIYKELKLPVSIGVANTKYLSKLITEYAKPDGIKYVSADNIGNFIKDIPIKEFPGIGKGLKMGENCDVDVLLVHAPSAEMKFVESGFGNDRNEVMYNDFVIVGPVNDPAKVSGMSTADAFKTIKEKEAKFLSRGDNSGTNKKEISMWEKVSQIAPEKDTWYIQTGQGMLTTINMASEKGGYTLTDRGTWIKYEVQKGATNNMKIVVENDKALFNQYSVITVNKDRCPNVKTELAKSFTNWIVKDETQKIIGEFKLMDKALFTPNAKK